MHITEIKGHYKSKKQIIKKRLIEFSKNKDYFYELCFCLLTPQSNAKKCYECIQILREKDFFNKNFDIKKYLRGKTRFYRNKSDYLIQYKKNHHKIRNQIKNIKNSKELRDYLVQNVKGIGYKESSHFLRNMGYRNLAILDRHILRNLKDLNVINEIPKSLNKKQYIEIEDNFQNFSKKINIPMDELDLLFWSIETGEVFR